MNNDDFNIFELGNVKLLSGEILYSAKLAYKTYGLLNTNKDNVRIAFRKITALPPLAHRPPANHLE